MIILLFFLTIVFYLYSVIDYFTLTFYIIFPTTGKGGPKSLSFYINKAIKKWNKNKELLKLSVLIPKEKMKLSDMKKVIKNKYTFIWLQRSSYIYLVRNHSNNELFSRVIYGPNVTPLRWYTSLNNTYEQFWCKVMSNIYGYISHSNRVKYQIMKNTKCNLYNYKYFILRPCIQLNLDINKIKNYNERIIDFLIYTKFSDENRKLEEKILISYLKKNYTIEVVKYGNHTKESLLNLSNNSKYVIYFSFYDTGALSLLEMRLMGVWPISHQIELIENGYGSYVKELDCDIHKSLSILDSIYKIVYNPKELANNIYNNLNCIKSLYNLIKYIKLSFKYSF